VLRVDGSPNFAGYLTQPCGLGNQSLPWMAVVMSERIWLLRNLCRVMAVAMVVAFASCTVAPEAEPAATAIPVGEHVEILAHSWRYSTP
jgi:hypothetical protein